MWNFLEPLNDKVGLTGWGLESPPSLNEEKDGDSVRSGLSFQFLMFCVFAVMSCLCLSACATAMRQFAIFKFEIHKPARRVLWRVAHLVCAWVVWEK